MKIKAKCVLLSVGLTLPMWFVHLLTSIASLNNDTRWDYGEERYQLLGSIDQRIFFVAYTLCGSIIRIISARKANQREVNRYENSKNKY